MPVSRTPPCSLPSPKYIASEHIHAVVMSNFKRRPKYSYIVPIPVICVEQRREFELGVVKGREGVREQYSRGSEGAYLMVWRSHGHCFHASTRSTPSPSYPEIHRLHANRRVRLFNIIPTDLFLSSLLSGSAFLLTLSSNAPAFPHASPSRTGSSTRHEVKNHHSQQLLPLGDVYLLCLCG